MQTPLSPYSRAITGLLLEGKPDCDTMEQFSKNRVGGVPGCLSGARNCWSQGCEFQPNVGRGDYINLTDMEKILPFQACFSARV